MKLDNGGSTLQCASLFMDITVQYILYKINVPRTATRGHHSKLVWLSLIIDTAEFILPVVHDIAELIIRCSWHWRDIFNNVCDTAELSYPSFMTSQSLSIPLLMTSQSLSFRLFMTSRSLSFPLFMTSQSYPFGCSWHHRVYPFRCSWHRRVSLSRSPWHFKSSPFL